MWNNWSLLLLKALRRRDGCSAEWPTLSPWFIGQTGWICPCSLFWLVPQGKNGLSVPFLLWCCSAFEAWLLQFGWCQPLWAIIPGSHLWTRLHVCTTWKAVSFPSPPDHVGSPHFFPSSIMLLYNRLRWWGCPRTAVQLNPYAEHGWRCCSLLLTLTSWELV